MVFIGSRCTDYGEMSYALPANVAHVQCVYLWDTETLEHPSARPGDKDSLADVARLHECLRSGAVERSVVERVLFKLAHQAEVASADFFYSEAAWRRLCASYEQSCGGESFTEYFWTIRNMHSPLLKLGRVTPSIPPGKVIHAISTGYAGVLGAMLRSRHPCSLVLTEHGIYTKERKIDLMNAFLRQPPEASNGWSRDLWARWFAGLGRMTYKSADLVTTLYEKNRLRQIADGAEPHTTRVIPNGIDVKRMTSIRARRPKRIPPVFGLLGRIVPIKDCKTFIRALRIVVSHMPSAQGWLIGPEDENPQYAQECRQLALSLGLQQHVSFLGFRKIDEVLPELGLLVLTSISEAFPLVLLEAFASGLPAIATDVGACRNIIEGNGEEDRAIGAAGAVVPIADPENTASAILALGTDEPRWRAAQAAGVARVDRYYTEKAVLAQYRQLYSEAGVGP